MPAEAAVVVSDQVVSAVSMVTKALADQFVPIAVEKLSTSSDGTPVRNIMLMWMYCSQIRIQDPLSPLISTLANAQS